MQTPFLCFAALHRFSGFCLQVAIIICKFEIIVQLSYGYAHSPPTTPTFDPDMREELLRWLDEEIMAIQHRHDETQRRLKER